MRGHAMAEIMGNAAPARLSASSMTGECARHGLAMQFQERHAKAKVELGLRRNNV